MAVALGSGGPLSPQPAPRDSMLSFRPKFTDVPSLFLITKRKKAVTIRTRASSERHVTISRRASRLARETSEEIMTRVRARVRPRCVISRCINRPRMKAFGFPRNLITPHFLSSARPSTRTQRRFPFPRRFAFLSSRDPLSRRPSFCVPPVSLPSGAAIRMRYIIKYFCVRAAGDNRGS